MKRKVLVNQEGQTLADTPDDPLFWALHDAFITNRNKAQSLTKDINEKEQEVRRLTRQRDANDSKAQAVLQHADRMGWDLRMAWEK